MRPSGAWGRRPPANPANEVTTGSDAIKAAIPVNPNPENPPNKEEATTEAANPANGVTTGFGVHLRGPGSGSPEPIPSASACEPFREAIELGLSQGRTRSSASLQPTMLAQLPSKWASMSTALSAAISSTALN